MPESLNIDADPFLQLLTDALRAGPGSPEWHQAVTKLKTSGDSRRDEYQMLVDARENLEGGKSYRQVRAGPGFTRKVLSGIEAEPGQNTPAVPTANLVAIGGAVVALGVLILIGFWLLHAGNSTPAEDLSNLYFGTTQAAVSFDAPLPGDWKLIGPLPLDPAGGLRPLTKTPPPAGDNYAGGGVVTQSGLPDDQPFAVEASFKLGHVNDDVIPQLFVTDQPDFSIDRGTSPHELVWLVRGGRARVVLPDGQIAGNSPKVPDGQTVTVRLIVGPQTAQVISGGETLWTGPSQLVDHPRYVGVRILRRSGDRKDAVVVQSVKIMK